VGPELRQVLESLQDSKFWIYMSHSQFTKSHPQFHLSKLSIGSSTFKCCFPTVVFDRRSIKSSTTRGSRSTYALRKLLNSACFYFIISVYCFIISSISAIYWPTRKGFNERVSEMIACNIALFFSLTGLLFR
jgi:hypothetical protein